MPWSPRRALTTWLTGGLVACAGAGPATTAPPPPAQPQPRPPPPPDAERGPPASEADCEALLRHVIDLELAQARPDGATPTADERARLEQTLRDAFLDECRATPARAVRCALAAPTSEAVARCE